MKLLIVLCDAIPKALPVDISLVLQANLQPDTLVILESIGLPTTMSNFCSIRVLSSTLEGSSDSYHLNTGRLEEVLALGPLPYP